MDWSLRDELTEAVDDTLSEVVRLLPLAAGVTDPDRDKVEFIAVLRTGDRRAERSTFGRGNDARVGVLAGGGTLRIDRTVNATLQVRKGDKIVAIERAGPPVFEVRSVDDRSHVRLICELGDVG